MDPHAELAELFAEACAAEPSEAAAAVISLHGRVDTMTLQSAIELLDHDSPRARSVAADVLGQLGAAGARFVDERFAALQGRMLVETSPIVLADLAMALGYLDDPRVVLALVPLVAHPEAIVREGVAMGLMRQDAPEAIAAEITLSGDAEGEVRNWATFALGAQTTIDTPKLRAALLVRLSDTHEGARHEAIAGLARRGETSVVEPLAAELAGHMSSLLVEAACELADPRLHEALLAARAEPEMTPWFAEGLDEAIARCNPNAEI
jgi:HEAT repeat protein